MDEGRGEGRATLRSAMFETVAGANVERIELVGEAVYATGNTLDNEIIGTDGENILRGGRGDDVIEGRGGADTLYSGGGIDTLVGGTGTATHYFENYRVTHVGPRLLYTSYPSHQPLRCTSRLHCV